MSVDDAMRFSSYTNPMTVLEHILSWKHLAPTTSDTLSCFPYTSHDPFILDDPPQIYFAANQTSLQHKIIEGICVSMCMQPIRGLVHYLMYMVTS